jgi:hypothetical protein
MMRFAIGRTAQVPAPPPRRLITAYTAERHDRELWYAATR